MTFASKKEISWFILLCLSVAGTYVLYFGLEPAPAAPTISWDPSFINETVSAGNSKTVLVSFVASEKMTSAQINIVPELQSYVQASPSTFANISEGGTGTVSLIISAPLIAKPQVFKGTIQMRSAIGGPKVFARPLPVTLNITVPSPQVSTDGATVFFDSPSGWIITEENQNGKNLYSPSTVTALINGDLETSPDMNILLLDNPTGLSLDDFLLTYLDGWYSFYKEKTASNINGREALILSDLSAENSHRPQFAAFIKDDQKILLVTSDGDAQQQFNDLLSSLVFM
jgi:hypothetical protein